MARPFLPRVVRGETGPTVHGRFRGADERRRVFSQNFLTDPVVVRRLVGVAGLTSRDVVVEPGPGEGAVTWHLARVAARVVAVERDARLADRLARRAPPNVTVHRGDFRAVSPPAGEFHLVGNIPFSVTSDIVAWCLDAASLRSATMVTQLEYARKRTGGYHRWSLLTVSTWPEFDWSFHGRVERGAFRPVPGVDAAILRLTRRARPLLAPGRMGLWRETVEAGFTGRGGSLAASLALVHPARRVKAAFARAGLDPRVPVGHVGPGDWLAVFAHL